MMSSVQRFRFVALMLAIWCLAACDAGSGDFAVGTLERDRIELVAYSSEPIVGIFVVEGDRVVAGTALVEQDAVKLNTAMTRARAEAARALALLREAEAGPRAQEFERARARIAAAKSSLVTAEQELRRQQSLISSNYASESQIDILQSRVDEARARREERDAELAELLEGTRSEQVDQARASHDVTQAVVEDLQIDLDRLVLRAPVDSVVEALPYELGERPQSGRTVVALLDSSRLYARVHIPEPKRTRLQTGSSALLRVDGYPESFSGRIRWIASAAAFTPYFALTQHDRSRLAYLAEIDFEQVIDLPSGVPVEARFPALDAETPTTGRDD